VPLVDVRRHDQVHLSVLVLEQHEDDSLRRRRALARDRHPRDGNCAAVRGLLELGTRERADGKMRAQERERVRPDGERRMPVVGEHPLPARQVAKLRGRGRRLERERQLLRLAVRPRDGLRPEHEPELPEEIAPLAVEAVARAALDERLEPAARELDAAREVADVPKRPVRLAHGHDCLRLLVCDGSDVTEADPNRRNPL
jgi:hypothetical protein